MVDPESVRRRLREMDRRLSSLRSIVPSGREAFLRDAGLQTQAERHLQLTLQAAIDIALHIAAEDSPETVDDYGTAFLVLSRLGIVEPDLAEQLRIATGLRNILVHGYLDVDPERIWSHLSRLEDLERFAAAVERHLDR